MWQATIGKTNTSIDKFLQTRLKMYKKIRTPVSFFSSNYQFNAILQRINRLIILTLPHFSSLFKHFFYHGL